MLQPTRIQGSASKAGSIQYPEGGSAGAKKGVAPAGVRTWKRQSFFSEQPKLVFKLDFANLLYHILWYDT